MLVSAFCHLVFLGDQTDATIGFDLGAMHKEMLGPDWVIGHLKTAYIHIEGFKPECRMDLVSHAIAHDNCCRHVWRDNVSAR
jgi:hypothetical protein